MEFYLHELDKGILVLAADGGLNADTAAEFLAEVEERARAGVNRIIVDCANLSYISSRGITALLGLHKRMKERGADVKVAGARSVVLDILHVAHLDRVFDMHPDVEQARLTFRPRAAAADTPG